MRKALLDIGCWFGLDFDSHTVIRFSIDGALLIVDYIHVGRTFF